MIMVWYHLICLGKWFSDLDPSLSEFMLYGMIERDAKIKEKIERKNNLEQTCAECSSIDGYKVAMVVVAPLMSSS